VLVSYAGFFPFFPFEIGRKVREEVMGFRFEPIAPSPEETGAAVELWRQLQGVKEVAISFVREGKTEVLPLPGAAFRVLVRVLEELMDGKEVAVVPVAEELTTKEAARIMKVSRPFLVKMLDEGSMRGRRVGKHRRVLLRDVLAYWELFMACK
jgi:excisionase family DNA binding protein